MLVRARRLVSTLLADGLDVVLVGYPQGVDMAPGGIIYDTNAAALDLYADYAEATEGVTFVDGRTLFGPYPTDADHFRDDDHDHPSATGSRVLGAAVAEALGSRCGAEFHSFSAPQAATGARRRRASRGSAAAPPPRARAPP